MSRLISIVVGVILLAGVVIWLTGTEVATGDPEESKPKEIVEKPSSAGLTLPKANKSPQRSESILRKVNKELKAVSSSILPSVVSVVARRKKPLLPPGVEIPESIIGTPLPHIGSGVVATSEGHVVTSFHVVSGAETIDVTLEDGRVFRAKLLGVDKLTDLALLKIEGKNFSPVVWGDSQLVSVGERVLAVGSPYNLPSSVSEGIVSAKGRSDLIHSDMMYQDFLQLDARVHPGSSGGAIVNMEGQLVALTSGMLSGEGEFEGLGFGIPSNIVRFVIESIMLNGRVVRGYLGVGLQEMDGMLSDSFGWEKTYGALVSEVFPEGPAQAAGIEAGDIIAKFDNRDVAMAKDLRLRIAQIPVGEEISMVVFRDRQKVPLKVKVGELPADFTLVSPEEVAMDPVALELLDGVSVVEMSGEIADQFGLPADLKGMIVNALAPVSRARSAGLKVGSVIVKIEQDEVYTREAFLAAVEKIKEKESVLLYLHEAGVKRFITIR